MTDEVAKLKVELEALNLQCQLARDHEIRYALQRTRLETARMQLMLKIVDAVGTAPPSPPAIVRESPAASYAVRYAPADKPGTALVIQHDAGGAKQKLPSSRQKRKPDGLPSVTQMVLAILDGEETGMRPRDITRIAQRKWWPGLRPAAVNAVAWKLHGEGRLAKEGRLYRLNGHAGE